MMAANPGLAKCTRQALAPILLCAVVSGCGGSGGGNDEPLADQQFPINDALVIGNEGPEGDSKLIFNNIVYPLNIGLEDIWGGVGNDYYRIDFTVADGDFELASETINGQIYQMLVPTQATAVFHSHMFNPGSSFNYTSYTYVADFGDLRGVGFFTDAYVGIDIDLDGEVEHNEKYPVIEGVVNFGGTAPDIELNFSVTLSNGSRVNGNYKGLFERTVR